MNRKYQIIEVFNPYVDDLRYIIKWWNPSLPFNYENPNVVKNVAGNTRLFNSIEEAEGYLRKELWPKLEDQYKVVKEY